MSFLAPLYLLGALAVTAPIVFHLIRRQTRQTVPFSTLMFVPPSTPREVRRGRLDDWPLLLLRCLVLLMLAAAFARPFVRDEALGTGTVARQVVIAIDQSASMRREDLWSRALETADDVLAGLSADDRCSVMTFDADAHWQSDERGMDAPSVQASRADLRAQMKDWQPTWLATDMTAAMSAAIARLSDPVTEEIASSSEKVIVLISDLQAGAIMDDGRTLAWQDGLRVDVRSIVAADDRNASLQPLPMRPDAMDQLPVRIYRHGGEQTESMQLELSDAQGNRVGAAIDAIVPPGQVRTVLLPLPTNLTDPRATGPIREIRLTGDSDVFDNRCFFVPPSTQSKTLLYVGPEGDNPRESLAYYLRRIPLGRIGVDVRFESAQSIPDAIDESTTPLLVIARPIETSEIDSIGRYVQGGGAILVVLQPSSADTQIPDTQIPDTQINAPQWTTSLQSICEDPQAISIDGVSTEPARLAQIDFESDLFVSLAAPSFSDFSRIVFWRHAIIDSLPADWKSVASLDDGSPAIASRDVGDGKVWLLTSGWQPSDSQLALSTKFVPLMHGWFWPQANQMPTQRMIVGEPLPILASENATLRGPITDDANAPVVEAVKTATDPQPRWIVPEPGIYQRTGGDQTRWVAVNLSPRESETSPLSIDQLEQLGVPVGALPDAADVVAQQRQLQRSELEQQQRLWRWILAAVVVVLLLETVMAGRRREKQATNLSVAKG